MTAPGKTHERKFLNDTIWNYGAFSLMAGSGVLINFYVAGVIGVEALGVFNQIMAIFVVVGQFATLGIHDSAQKHMAEHAEDAETGRAVSAAAVQATVVFAGVVALLMYLAAGLIGDITESAAVGAGVAIIAPGIALFALNKTMLGVLNGQRRMPEYAIMQSIRVLTILTVCLYVGWRGLSAEMLAWSFTLAETVLVVPLLVMTRPGIVRVDTRARDWVRRHVVFGVKALPNGFLAESFIRIDIIMLGIFLSDTMVGVYSFAALFVEGLFQVPVVVRTVANPVLVRLVHTNAWEELARFAKRVFLAAAGLFVLVAAGVLIVLPYLVPFFPDNLVVDAHALLFPLIAGLFVYAGFIPMDHLLLQAGMPGRQSAFMGLNVVSNIVFNAILIPVFGVWGAAYATAGAFVFSALALNIAAARWLNLKRGVLWMRAG